MALPKGLLPRGNFYYFQARVPKQYQAHYPKPLIREKLPADNLKEAVRLTHERWAQLHQEFARIDATGSKLKAIPTGDEADHLIALAIHSRMSADDEIRSAGVDDFMFDRLGKSHDEAENTQRQAVSRGLLTSHAKAFVTDWLLGYRPLFPLMM